MVNIGSWGLPELGWTEAAAKFLSNNNTTDLSNALTFNYGNQSNNTPQITPPITSNNPNSPTSTKTVAKISAPGTQATSFNQVPNSTPSVPSDQSLNDQINSIYDPSMALLGQQESNVRSQADTQKQGLNDQATYLQQMLDSQVKQLQGQTTDQQNALDLGKRSALDQASNMFNQLQQQVQSKFGQGTGAGAFISDLQGQELLRNQGKIQSGYTDSVKAITDYANKVQEQSFTEYQRIQRELNTGIKSIDDELQNRLTAINGDRTQLQSAKNQQKMDVLRSAMENARNMQNQRDSALFNLNLWKEQQQTLVKNQISTLQSGYADTLSGQQQNMDSATTNPGFSQFGGGNTNDNQATVYKNPYLKQQNSTEDPLNQLFDPSSYFN